MSEVGNIRFSVGLTGKKQFTNEVNSMSNQVQGKLNSSFSKLGSTIAAAFSIAVITKFASACVQLASDLQEVQNVVNVTYKSMNGQVNEFAKTCAKQYGLSEKMAKQYMGTLGSMATAFGFSEQEAYEMSKTLTGLSGDVASFYNLTQDVAYTKLKSVFTGETEALKDLGVVMSQVALDEFALANGFGKTTKEMTEQEKVSLRLAFVTNALSNASGDFARTSDGWANQTKILSLQLDQLKTNIGDILIHFLTPLLQALNKLVEYLVVATAKLKELLGIQVESSSGGGVVSDLAEEYDQLAESAEKASKTVFSFDNLTKLSSSNQDTSTSSSSSGVISNIAGGEQTNEQLEETQSLLDKIMQEIDNMQKAFMKTDLGQLFLDCSLEIVDGCKKIIDSIISVGKDVGTGFVYGTVNAFKNKEGLIKDTIMEMLTLQTGTFTRFSNYAEALSTIFSPMGGENGIKLWEELNEILINIFSIVGKMGARFHDALSKILLEPIIENAENLRDVFDDILRRVGKALEPIEEFLTQVGDNFDKLWEDHISPFVDNISSGLGNIIGTICEVYEQSLKPILDEMGESWDILWEEHIKPFADKFSEEFGGIMDTLNELWVIYLEPYIEWLSVYVLPIVVQILNTIWKVVCRVLGGIFDVLGELMRVLGGVIDFLVGVFTFDWERAWSGLKDIVLGVIWAIDDAISAVLESIGDLITGIMDIGKIEFGDYDIYSNMKKATKVANSILSIPGLNGHAIGGVIAPRNPHLVVVGDNNNENEVISPISTMKQAFTEAIRENNMSLSGTSGGTINIQSDLYMNGRVAATSTNTINLRDNKVRG